jgi:hypothetical protein
MQNLSMENNVPIIPIFMENKARNILVRVMLYTAFLWPVLVCVCVCVCVYIYIYIYGFIPRLSLLSQLRAFTPV